MVYKYICGGQVTLDELLADILFIFSGRHRTGCYLLEKLAILDLVHHNLVHLLTLFRLSALAHLNFEFFRLQIGLRLAICELLLFHHICLHVRIDISGPIKRCLDLDRLLADLLGFYWAMYRGQHILDRLYHGRWLNAALTYHLHNRHLIVTPHAAVVA